MYIFIREGSTEKNIEALIPLVTPTTVSRCCFATDDCHADLLYRSGHIDRCIRSAISAGLEPELAFRMATLSPAERFGLTDRGALTPGRRADFCILENSPDIRVKETFSRGLPVRNYTSVPVKDYPSDIQCQLPTREMIRISGRGTARVIGLVMHQILTESLTCDVDAAHIPDFDRDLLKAVVCNRYGRKQVGRGIVHGFRFDSGAIAASVSHDAHNIVAAGTSDKEILSAIGLVIQAHGGMSAVRGSESVILPLECAGLMSTLPVKDAVQRLDELALLTRKMAGISEPFMYLSFLALTVVPHLRITDRGLFDFAAFQDVPLFL
ncbi:MAG: adenine deaminase C-terminal domain-containing protein [Methanoregula sp.]|jgi:adenine deaminase